MWWALSQAVQLRPTMLLLRLSRQTTPKTDLCLPDLHLSENRQSHRRHQQQWEISRGSMAMSTKMLQIHTPSRTRTTSGELCRWNMLLLGHKLNVENRQLSLPRRRHQVQGRELVQEVKVQWRLPQASQRGESSQRRSHCLRILQEMLSIKADGHRAHVNNKAWPLHPDPDETNLDQFPTLTTSQHMHLLLSPLLDRILVVR
jgi:hypothetical protein